MLTTIVVPLDGSEFAERALPYATRLTRGARGWLVLARVAAPRGVISAESLERESGALEALADRERAAHIAVDTCACYADQVDLGRAIAELAHQRRADLIVMATHGRAGLGRLLQPSVAEQVVREARLPVLLIPPTVERHWSGTHPLRIMVPLDGSELAEVALGPAAQLADALRASLLLVRVVEPTTFEPFSAQTALANASDALEQVAERLRTSSRSVRVRAVGGFALPTISSLAREEQVDLIAMATHGRTGLARLALGSVAAGTLKDSRQPIMLIRPVEAALSGARENQSPDTQLGGL